MVDVSGPEMLPHAFLHVTHGGDDLKVEAGAGAALRAHEVNAQGASGPIQVVPVILASPEVKEERQRGTGSQCLRKEEAGGSCVQEVCHLISPNSASTTLEDYDIVCTRRCTHFLR